MSTNLKRFSFSLKSTVGLCCAFVLISSNTYAQTWYDSQGRALSVKGREVKLKTEAEKRKTLPLLPEEIPSVIKEREELDTERVTEPRKVKKRSRRNSYFYGNSYGLGYSSVYFPSFNNGVYTRKNGSRYFIDPRYNYQFYRDWYYLSRPRN